MHLLPSLLAVCGVLSSISLVPGVLAQNTVTKGAPHQSAQPQEVQQAQQAQQARGLSSEPLAPGLRKLQIVRSSRIDVRPFIIVEAAEVPEEPTRVLDHSSAERLMRNEGVTLQWIGWEERGPLWVAVTQSGHWSLMGGQAGEAGASLDLEGFITEIGTDYFIFEGTIKVVGTPDDERLCNTTKQWRFAVTQNRSYYRLREFEWCDGLTDYIDIYFPPALR